MEKKRCKVIMLPTEKESCIHANKFKTDSGYEYKLTYHDVPSKCKNDGLCSGNQHLYITSDDKIEAGDWCLFFWDGNKEGELGQIGSEPQQYFPENGHTLNKNLRKIIATTDSELKLPQIPQSFIEEYCRKGGIEYVDVEYDYGMVAWKIEPVVNSYNTINIHPIKDTYTREEVYKIAKVAYRMGAQNHEDATIERFDKFIKENL